MLLTHPLRGLLELFVRPLGKPALVLVLLSLALWWSFGTWGVCGLAMGISSILLQQCRNRCQRKHRLQYGTCGTGQGLAWHPPDRAERKPMMQAKIENNHMNGNRATVALSAAINGAVHKCASSSHARTNSRYAARRELAVFAAVNHRTSVRERRENKNCITPRQQQATELPIALLYVSERPAWPIQRR